MKQRKLSFALISILALVGLALFFKGFVVAQGVDNGLDRLILQQSDFPEGAELVGRPLADDDFPGPLSVVNFAPQPDLARRAEAAARHPRHRARRNEQRQRGHRDRPQPARLQSDTSRGSQPVRHRRRGGQLEPPGLGDRDTDRRGNALATATASCLRRRRSGRPHVQQAGNRLGVGSDPRQPARRGDSVLARERFDLARWPHGHVDVRHGVQIRRVGLELVRFVDRRRRRRVGRRVERPGLPGQRLGR